MLEELSQFQWEQKIAGSSNNLYPLNFVNISSSSNKKEPIIYFPLSRPEQESDFL